MKKLISNSQVNIQIVAITTAALILLAAVCYIAGYSMIIPLLLLVIGIHLFYFKKANVNLFLNMSLLLVLIMFATDALIRYSPLPNYYLYYSPVASIGMLVILLYNDVQLAFLMSLAASIVAAMVAGGDMQLMMIFFVGSTTAAYSIKGARTRGELIQTGFFIGLVQVFAIILLNPSLDFLLSRSFLLQHFRPLLINGFVCFFVVITTLKIFEYLFGVLTNFSLLELSDFNQPLLKRMIIEAPGTYHHSLMVSNLAEAAADAIGAHSLLTRVGAYYHDIGKLEKPEYFNENQILSGNKHEKLEPSISKLVILKHVKEGMDLARKYRLNPVIAKFIPEHHGTGLIYYFYQRALEDAQEDERVDQETYRYPGPKPQSRETAIVLLADSVEGAVRAMDDPTPSRIDEVVRKVSNNKFIDGQLDECNLTLKEIGTICVTFSRVLSAIYHSRVKYPEKKNENGNNTKKSSEKNPNQIPPNREDHKNNSSS